MKKQGKQTYLLSSPVSIISTASIVGPKEKDGPLHQYFDQCLEDEFWGEKSWEKAESKLQKKAAELAMRKAQLSDKEIDYILGGDLINQLKDKKLKGRLLIPSVMLRSEGDVFLDDVSLKEAEKELGVEITPVSCDGYELADIILSE